jgi:hypothetical protein
MGVVVRDARRLSPAAQEDLRRRAVAAVKHMRIAKTLPHLFRGQFGSSGVSDAQEFGR